ncbi:LINE-1 reverse transcriptase-like [Vitis vinifera]|uniref:LINE-1 reverse transcriptase-like n=1 Tax=Vitis vinifera TaxID=29760 RepID=A0A438BN79_VITVI|nr:LINE-1 reverse transcriptase-like [Vitis vinifera]
MWRRDRVGGISSTDSALLEEDARYVPSSSGMVTLDPSPPFFSSFGRTPRKESFDRSGTLVESIKEDCLCKEIGQSQQFAGKCWDLVEISNDSMEDDRKALCLARPISQEEGAWWMKDGKKEFGGREVSGLGALEAQGTAGGILICWDKRTLEILEMEMGQFTISCRLRNVEDGKTWIFTGVYGPFSKDDRDTFWGELGAIRESGMILGVLGWGRNNQAWARLDRFLVTQDWLDCFSGVLQCRLPRPVSDHFPIILKGGGGRGRASFRVASKLKFLKDKIKSWNREVFGRVEVNKNPALQQVEFWIGAAAQSLNHAEAEGLEQPFTEAEIHLALMGMNGDKAPGPDGFTVAFWQFCWEFVKEEIVDVFKEFYEDKSPISLLGGVYKLLAKVLSNRIKGVLDKVVSPDQNAFVKGRQILDASLIANEVIDYWLKRKEKGVICKLDIEKAYDSINWNFLMKVMRKMGFGDRWLKWIWWCISTASFSILVNGVPAGYFSNSRGLRQGDPLSPYLFVLGMEVLSAMLRRAVDGGFISGCSIQGRGGMELNVSHLLFADDTIIFCEARQDHITYLSWILVWFEAASGLRINLAKSEVIPVGEVEDIEMLAVELGCKVGTLPSVYLGLPLGAKHKATAMWDGVEARMRRRLALWKRQYLSKGGRITLIKALWPACRFTNCLFFACLSWLLKGLKSFKGTFFGEGKFGKKDSSYQLGGGVYP